MKKVFVLFVVVLISIISLNAQTKLNPDEIPCNSNTFWAISGYIEQFNLNGNVVTSAGIIAPMAPGNSLAICNNLDGGLTSPTFYVGNETDPTVISYYNGSNNWTAISQTPPYLLFNCGGNGDNLYFQGGGFGYPSNLIVKYSGSSFSIINYDNNNILFSVADLAVDKDGNVWCFKTDTFPPWFNHQIYVLSPSGTLIKQFSLNFNSTNAYGCFILDNTLYVGLGESNPVHPNSLIPITFTSNSANIGTPIPMLGTGWMDLASCNAGSPLSYLFSKIDDGFSISPNPFSHSTRISLGQSYNNIALEVFNLQGQKVAEQHYADCSEINLQRGGLSEGMYFLKLTLDGKMVETKKIVVSD